MEKVASLIEDQNIRSEAKFTIRISDLLTCFIIAYLYWVSFEWFFLSAIKSYHTVQIIRNTIDILPLTLAATISAFYPVRLKTPEFKIFAGFFAIIIISVISLLIETKNALPVISYIGVTFRFVPFIYLIKYTSEGSGAKFFRHIKIIFWIQAILSILSIVNKDRINEILLPPAAIFGVNQPTTFNDPGISTTFVNTIEFSFFILALTIVYLCLSNNKNEKFFVFVSCVFMLIFSYSIASILALVILMYYATRHKVSYLFGVLAGSIVFFLLFREYFYELLGMDIKTWIRVSSEFNRVGYFTRLLPEFLTSNVKDIILGIGYDGNVVDRQLAMYSNIPKAMINNVNNLKYLKDVYWLSILFAQGVIALFITFGILWTIYHYVRKVGIWNNFVLVKAFVFIIIMLGFFNQIMDVKGFTLCFWIVVGFTINKSSLNYKT